jgi:hypothetical protein
MNLSAVDSLRFIDSSMGHVHISEDNLGPFMASDEHIRLSEYLRHSRFSGIIVYETKNIDPYSLSSFLKIYSK